MKQAYGPGETASQFRAGSAAAAGSPDSDMSSEDAPISQTAAGKAAAAAAARETITRGTKADADFIIDGESITLAGLNPSILGKLGANPGDGTQGENLGNGRARRRRRDNEKRKEKKKQRAASDHLAKAHLPAEQLRMSAHTREGAATGGLGPDEDALT
jgi:hypothetical protein